MKPPIARQAGLQRSALTSHSIFLQHFCKPTKLLRQSEAHGNEVVRLGSPVPHPHVRVATACSLPGTRPRQLWVLHIYSKVPNLVPQLLRNSREEGVSPLPIRIARKAHGSQLQHRRPFVHEHQVGGCRAMHHHKNVCFVCGRQVPAPPSPTPPVSPSSHSTFKPTSNSS